MFFIIHHRSLCVKVKNFCWTKLTHRRSMFDDRQLFQCIHSDDFWKSLFVLSLAFKFFVSFNTATLFLRCSWREALQISLNVVEASLTTKKVFLLCWRCPLFSSLKFQGGKIWFQGDVLHDMQPDYQYFFINAVVFFINFYM